MHYLAPIPIMLGITGAIFGLMWLIGAGAEDDGGPDVGLAFFIGDIYLVIRLLKALARDPMSVLPAFGILALSAGLIWLGIAML